MCGISGAYKFGGGEIKEADLTSMRDTLVHRGPDGGANYLSPDGRAGLSQRRLAIIDLNAVAACPMPNEDGSVWITFNGEIYNFMSLREELVRRGHTFRSHGDTEVILHGYEEFGADVVNKLNGIFAFAIWDDRKKMLFAARDHAGIKPFYYAVQNGAFYFGSEIKAILTHPDFKKEMEESAAAYYLAFSSMPAPYTLFRDVWKLPAAHALTVDASGQVKTWEYWNPLRPARKVPEGKSEAFYVEALRNLLADSISMQMVSDVPFGCFLSGGIDSSLNAALMSKALGAPVETFSIGTKEDGERYNEFEHSRFMAERLGAKRHERLVGFKDFLEYLPQYGKFADDPNGDPTCFLVFYLSELVRQNGVIVAQSGEGGDELFAGYGTYRRASELYSIWRVLEKLPAPLRVLPHRAAKSFGASDFSLEHLRRLARGEEPFWGHAIAFSPSQKAKLLSPRLRNNPAWHGEYEVIASHYRTARQYAPKADFLNRIAYLELKMRLADFLLMRVDKMSMAHSIEVRVPFLDYRIVELALHIPEKIKLKGGELKHVLKKAARGALPDSVINRKKQGFGAPIEEWFAYKTTAAPLVDKILNSRLKERDFFDYDYVRSIAARHAKGENQVFRLMNLLTLSLWYDYWFS